MYHATNRGVGDGLRDGFQAARYDLVCTNCADLPFDVADLARAVPFMLSRQADVCVMVRHDRSANSVFRKLTSYVNYLIIRLLFNTPVHDTISFRCTGAPSAVYPVHAKDVFVPPELIIKSYRAGYKIVEFRTTFHPRKAGRSKYGHPKHFNPDVSGSDSFLDPPAPEKESPCLSKLQRKRHRLPQRHRRAPLLVQDPSASAPNPAPGRFPAASPPRRRFSTSAAATAPWFRPSGNTGLRGHRMRPGGRGQLPGQGRSALVGDARRIPLRTDSMDVVTILDLLEHVDDDRAVLEECSGCLSPAASCWSWSPAFMALWTSFATIPSTSGGIPGAGWCGCCGTPVSFRPERGTCFPSSSPSCCSTASWSGSGPGNRIAARDGADAWPRRVRGSTDRFPSWKTGDHAHAPRPGPLRDHLPGHNAATSNKQGSSWTRRTPSCATMDREFPPMVIVDFTNVCNLRCVHCVPLR